MFDLDGSVLEEKPIQPADPKAMRRSGLRMMFQGLILIVVSIGLAALFSRAGAFAVGAFSIGVFFVAFGSLRAVTGKRLLVVRDKNDNVV